MLLLPAIVYGLLWLPVVQQKITERALSEIMKRTNNYIAIGKLYLRPFNRLQLTDVYASGLNGDTLLYIGQLSAGFSLPELLHNRLVIHSVALQDADFRIGKDSPDSDFNFQFLLDAFASQDTTKNDTTNTPWAIEIDNITLKNVNLSYDVCSESLPDTNVFSPHHLQIRDLNATIALRSLDLENLDVAIHSFSCTERSGFSIKNFSGQLTSLQKKLHAANISLELPHSTINIPQALLDYSGLEWSHLLSKAQYDIQMNIPSLVATDLSALIPSLSVFPDPLSFNATLSGTLPWIEGRFYGEDLARRIQIRGTAGYDLDATRAVFDVQVHTDRFSAGPYIPRVGLPLDTVNVSLLAKGAWSRKSGVNATADFTVQRLDYNGYSYKQIRGDASYRNDSIRLNLNSADPTVSFRLNAAGNVAARGGMDLHIQLDSVDLKQLNFASGFEQMKVSVRDAQLTVKGFDVEQGMDAIIKLDSLSLKTEKGVFAQKYLAANYLSSSGRKKNIEIDSDFLRGTVQGHFRFSTIATAVTNTLSSYFPAVFKYKKLNQRDKSTLKASFVVNDTRSLSETFALPVAIPQQSVLKAGYEEEHHWADIHLQIPQLSVDSAVTEENSLILLTDTATGKVQLSLQSKLLQGNRDTIGIQLQAVAGAGKINWNLQATSDNPDMSLDGNIAGNIRFEKNGQRGSSYKMFAELLPTVIHLNQQQFHLEPSQFSWQEDTCRIEHFRLSHSATEYLEVDGTISSSPQDTLRLNISQLQLATVMNAFRSNVRLTGEANGEIVILRALEAPLIMTRGLEIKDIVFQDKPVGTIALVSGWSEEKQGLLLTAALKQADGMTGGISGFMFPRQDLLSLKMNMGGIDLDWFTPFTSTFLSDLKGALAIDLNVTGKISQPDLSGTISFQDAGFGVNMTGCRYQITDSIVIKPSGISFENFRIKDERGKDAVLSGSIAYTGFSNFKPDVDLALNDFTVLNNAGESDSLFYGNLRLNGHANISSYEKEVLVKMGLHNSGQSRVYVKLPEGASEAQRYTGITFVDHGDSAKKTAATPLPVMKRPDLPVKLQIALSLDKELTLGSIFNPSTKDEVFANGAGNINFNYDMDSGEMDILGDYTINAGQCAVSLKNITRKVFNIQPGGEITFKGDPMKTAFDVTAVYSLRADLTTLDPSFGTDSYLPTTRVPVNCLIGISGDINKMNISYNVELPNSNENIRRKVAGLLYSDDIRIHEIAYLMTFGSFWPPESNGSNNTGTNWVSLASSPLSSLLNNMLSGVLNENWTIGTELHATDDDLSNVEMDVNVSTRLFHDRVTVNSNIGYKNNSTTNTNFTGDFDVQWKLTKSGDLRLKVYTITNDAYSAPAPTTQGVGVIYNKVAKEFRQLFKKRAKTSDE